MLRLVERRWLIAAFLVLGWVLGTTTAMIVTPKYRSETVILIEQQKVPENYVVPNIPAEVQQEWLQSMSEQILSRTRLLALINKFGLYGNVRPGDPESLVERMRKDIGIQLTASESRRDQYSAFKISYSSSTPVLARQVTTELTSLFIDENLQNRKDLSEDTTSFLKGELDQARQSLTEQEQRVRQFRTEHPGELPEQLQSNLQILGTLQVQLQAANDALSQADQHKMYLQSLLHQYQASGTAARADGTAIPFTTPTLQSQLAALRAQLAELEGRYTDHYPDVLRVKQQIAELEAQQARIGLPSSGGGSPTSTADAVSAPTVTNAESAPLIQLSGELAASELQIKNQRATIRKLEEKVEIYQARLNATPVREQQAAAVTRDYDQSRTYYEALLGKKLQSEMATDLEKRRQGEQFHMVDPPNLPSQPYWPNRLAFSLGGLALGLGVGVAIALLMDLLSPRIYHEQELSEFIGSGYTLGLPILATQRELLRGRTLRVVEVAVAGVLAAIIPAITFLTYHKHW